ncbi:hypothetical protein SHELI_v1c09840 [Spiroplasma helicoides]|uniref:Uncharacterized protein n=1 Tax=Spiroplasma helicoides TaxID=216938 RepID=A0A1B3SLW7_9MOLU|nr:hypothetical protein [Spiroplasma helicoides]AOG60931.1 hypothetical protein SHELI_v1c09840 [Spiroplasma helicoides]
MKHKFRFKNAYLGYCFLIYSFVCCSSFTIVNIILNIKDLFNGRDLKILTGDIIVYIILVVTGILLITTYKNKQKNKNFILTGIICILICNFLSGILFLIVKKDKMTENEKHTSVNQEDFNRFWKEYTRQAENEAHEENNNFGVKSTIENQNNFSQMHNSNSNFVTEEKAMNKNQEQTDFKVKDELSKQRLKMQIFNECKELISSLDVNSKTIIAGILVQNYKILKEIYSDDEEMSIDFAQTLYIFLNKKLCFERMTKPGVEPGYIVTLTAENLEQNFLDLGTIKKANYDMLYLIISKYFR